MIAEPAPSRTSVHLPLGLLTLAIAVFFGAQIGAANQGTKTMEWQLTNLQKQRDQIKEAKQKFSELITQRAALVTQSTQVQERYQQLLEEVLDLAKTDRDAAAVVEKWKIQRTAPAAPPAGSATPPATAPAGQ